MRHNMATEILEADLRESDFTPQHRPPPDYSDPGVKEQQREKQYGVFRWLSVALVLGLALAVLYNLFFSR